MKTQDIQRQIEQMNETLRIQEESLIKLRLNLQEKQSQLPLLRETAYPKNQDGTDEAKESFKLFLDSITIIKKEINELEFHTIIKSQKKLSSMKYLLINIEKMKQNINDGSLKVLSINLTQGNIENIDVSIIENLSKSNEMTTITYPYFSSDLKNNIESAQFIFTFSREDELEQLRNFGILDATIDNKKFISIHHLGRFFSDFERKDFKFYLNYVNIEESPCNSNNIMNIILSLLDLKD